MSVSKYLTSQTTKILVPFAFLGGAFTGGLESPNLPKRLMNGAARRPKNRSRVSWTEGKGEAAKRCGQSSARVTGFVTTRVISSRQLTWTKVGHCRFNGSLP